MDGPLSIVHRLPSIVYPPPCMTSLPANLAALQEAARRGDRLKYLFFWSHEPRTGSAVDAACLSQWYPAPFVVDGVTYPTAEHFMMAEKARLFGDSVALEHILQAPHPGAAKQWGRQVNGFDESVWQRERFAIVVRGNRAKFDRHEALRDFLLGTKRRVLVEASPVDRVWGIGLSADDVRAGNPLAWRGLNLLGFALMHVRDP